MSTTEDVRLSSAGGTAKVDKKLQRFVKRMQVPQDQVLEIVEQLAIMFETGLNLSQALEVLERQSGNPHVAELVGSIRAAVEEGAPLSQAMMRQDWAFSEVSIALVRAGEMTGDLGRMLKKVAAFMERDITTRKKVRGALAYPAFMLVLAIGVVIFLLVNVFPKFAALFSKNPDALPGPTKFFMALSDFLVASGAWLLPVAVIGVGGLLVGLRSKAGKRLVDPMLIKTPAFGPLIKTVSIARSFHVLGVMMNAGLNVLDALGLARSVAGNYVYESMWEETRESVEEGRDISANMLDNPLVPPAEAAMISLGERSGTLPGVLEKISAHHEKRVESAIRAFVGVIEPAMTIIMGVVVALIVTSLILPMFSISKAIN